MIKRFFGLMNGWSDCAHYVGHFTPALEALSKLRVTMPFSLVYHYHVDEHGMKKSNSGMFDGVPFGLRRPSNEITAHTRKLIINPRCCPKQINPRKSRVDVELNRATNALTGQNDERMIDLSKKMKPLYIEWGDAFRQRVFAGMINWMSVNDPVGFSNVLACRFERHCSILI